MTTTRVRIQNRDKWYYLAVNREKNELYLTRQPGDRMVWLQCDDLISGKKVFFNLSSGTALVGTSTRDFNLNSSYAWDVKPIEDGFMLS